MFLLMCILEMPMIGVAVARLRSGDAIGMDRGRQESVTARDCSQQGVSDARDPDEIIEHGNKGERDREDSRRSRRTVCPMALPNSLGMGFLKALQRYCTLRGVISTRNKEID